MRKLAILFALFALCACGSPEPFRLRVLSYNIHHGQGTDGRFDLARLAEVIDRLEPDLVALQEVDHRTRRAKGVDQAAELGRLTGMHSWFGKAMDFSGGGYGDSPLLNQRLYYQYRSADVYRGAQLRGCQAPGHEQKEDA